MTSSGIFTLFVGQYYDLMNIYPVACFQLYNFAQSQSMRFQRPANTFPKFRIKNHLYGLKFHSNNRKCIFRTKPREKETDN
jgi:hypothetical protein